MSEYMTVKHPDAFVDYPTHEDRRKTWAKYYSLDNAVPCPACKGRGGWNLKLNAYGEGKHFKAGCMQCTSWGLVKAGSDDAACIHEWDSGKNVGRCLNNYTCKKCGHVRQIDSSD